MLQLYRSFTELLTPQNEYSRRQGSISEQVVIRCRPSAPPSSGFAGYPQPPCRSISVPLRVCLGGPALRCGRCAGGVLWGPQGQEASRSFLLSFHFPSAKETLFKCIFRTQIGKKPKDHFFPEVYLIFLGGKPRLLAEF